LRSPTTLSPGAGSRPRTDIGSAKNDGGNAPLSGQCERRLLASLRSSVAPGGGPHAREHTLKPSVKCGILGQSEPTWTSISASPGRRHPLCERVASPPCPTGPKHPKCSFHRAPKRSRGPLTGSARRGMVTGALFQPRPPHFPGGTASMQARQGRLGCLSIFPIRCLGCCFGRHRWGVAGLV
jgi:hypothetical protein